MRIAFLTSRFPYPLISGDRLRAYHFLRHLARSHEVTLYTLGALPEGGSRCEVLQSSGLQKKTFQPSLAAYGRNAFCALFTSLPFQVKLYESKTLMEILASDIERGLVDLLFVQLLRMAEYVLPFPRMPRILDMVDSLCLHYCRMTRKWASLRWWGGRVDRNRVCRYESRVPALFDRVLLTSPVDLQAVQARAGVDNLILIPNGVDRGAGDPAGGTFDRRRIVFSGKLDFLPNSDAAIYFARKVFPLVRRSVAEAHFVVAGWNPPYAVRALGRLAGVTVRPNVPDVRREIASAAVSVAPLRFATGIQNKILEALAEGVPVVATPLAAQAFRPWEPLSPILIGRTPDELAQHVVSVLMDSAYRGALHRAAQMMAEAGYRWDHVLAPLDSVLEDSVAARAAKLAGTMVGQGSGPGFCT